MPRERWGSKLGVILAVAGSAIGLGNFLRFPVQAANNGGGAFMIPYFVAVLLLGLPLMWIEWTVGRFGGGFGHSTAPGMFHSMWQKNRFIKYFGVIGIFGPIVIYVFYVYVESWLLGYSFFALLQSWGPDVSERTLSSFLNGYQGVEQNQYFGSVLPAYGFFVVTFLVNLAVVWFGIKGGIERLCKFAMPVLFIMAGILLVRVLTLGTPDAAHPENSISNGLGFLWNPKWEALKEPKVWLAAAGQVFFTLSCGIGVILTYASYLTRRDDVALSGLTAAATNETAEVVLGGSIVIPAAFAFLGAAGVSAAAAGGGFNLGFVTMPLVLDKLPAGNIFGFLWFGLLFLAGITSSISLAQPAIAFLEDEFGFTRRRAAAVFAAVTFVLCQSVIFGLRWGVLDELDFWGGTFALVLFGTIEAVLFAWVFGMERAWTEMHAGSDITIPGIYRWIIKYVTPVFLLVILGTWFATDGLPFILLRSLRGKIADAVANKAPPEELANLTTTFHTQIATRVGLLAMFVVLAVLVMIAWRRKQRAEGGQV